MKPKNYGPPRYDVIYRKSLRNERDLMNAKNRAFYMSRWHETQKFLNNSNALHRVMKTETFALFRQIQAEIQDTSRKSDETTSNLHKELRMSRVEKGNLFEDRPAYMIYAKRGKLSAAEYQRTHRDDPEESWFIAALKKREKLAKGKLSRSARRL